MWKVEKLTREESQCEPWVLFDGDILFWVLPD